MYIAMSIPVIIFVSLIMWARNTEKKKWNNGICAKCNTPWEMYDTDSQGGRMYHCKNRHSCDISYNVDK